MHRICASALSEKRDFYWGPRYFASALFDALSMTFTASARITIRVPLATRFGRLDLREP